MSDRRKNCFIWGHDQYEFANLSWFVRALKQRDIQAEEYYLHSVLNGPGHARNLTNEVFQSARRNKVTNFVDISSVVSTTNSDIVNEVNSDELTSRPKYSRVVDATTIEGNRDFNGEACIRISRVISELYVELPNEDVQKVFAWMISNSGVDSYFPSPEHFLASIDLDLAEMILHVVSGDLREVRQITTWIGTRHRFEVARSTLVNVAKEKLKFLLP